MSLQFRKLTVIVVCGFLFCIDRFLKWQALHGWASDRLLHQWFGWHPFLNPGVAFGIPVPGWLVIVLTVPVLALVLFLIFKEQRAKSKEQSEQVNNWRLLSTLYSLLLVFAGALSNFLDRLFYKHTVDYLLIFTGVINLADVMIALGFVIYFIGSKKSIKS